MRRTLTRVLLALVAAAGALFSLPATSGIPPAEAAGATLAFPTASCSRSSATVDFSWTSPAGATESWIDLSLTDNGFVGGSYQSVGPFAGSTNAYSWPGLKTYEPYFWRVGSKTAAGTVVSETGVFVACSEPILLASNPECNGKPEASVMFRWAPSVPAAQQQWLDVSTQSSFSSGSYTSYGYFAAGASAYKLDGVKTGTYYYRVNSLLSGGEGRGTITRSFTVACGGVDTDLHQTGDKLIYPALGIVAPVNVRKIGPDGAMLNPEGMDDVVRYDFSGFPGMGGYPGNGGTTALAGHLDYRPYYPAVFYNLTKARQGDVIEYRRADGIVKKYSVAWVGSVPFEQSISEYLAATNPESMVLITCDGTFSEAGGYSNRAIVYAVATN
jgi:hypothetical protein